MRGGDKPAHGARHTGARNKSAAHQRSSLSFALSVHLGSHEQQTRVQRWVAPTVGAWGMRSAPLLAQAALDGRRLALGQLAALPERPQATARRRRRRRRSVRRQHRRALAFAAAMSGVPQQGAEEEPKSPRKYQLVEKSGYDLSAVEVQGALQGRAPPLGRLPPGCVACVVEVPGRPSWCACCPSVRPAQPAQRRRRRLPAPAPALAPT